MQGIDFFKCFSKLWEFKMVTPQRPQVYPLCGILTLLKLVRVEGGGGPFIYRRAYVLLLLTIDARD